MNMNDRTNDVKVRALKADVFSEWLMAVVKQQGNVRSVRKSDVTMGTFHVEMENGNVYVVESSMELLVSL